jgi:N4-gp56 family major capsid protein
MAKGTWGSYAGIKFVRDNNIYTSALGVSSLVAYASVLLGKGALAVSELTGGVKTYLKESGSQDTSNPVNEFVTFGWKVMFVPKRLNTQSGLIVLSADA